MLGMVGVGCDGNRAPSAPSAVQQPVPPPVVQPAPTPAPRPAQIPLQGEVTDTAFRPLAGARIEVVGGLGVGASAVTDATGQFKMTEGTFDDTTQVRATHASHVAATKTVTRTCDSCPASHWVSFFLAVPTSPVSLAGDYTLTFTADTACTDLPAEARTRSYEATLTALTGSTIPANTWFNVTVSGAQFLPYSDAFNIGVAGDYVALSLDCEGGPCLIEESAPNTYVSIGGVAAASVGPAPSTIATSFEGLIEFCQLRSPMKFRECANPVAHKQCVSNNHQLMLARR